VICCDWRLGKIQILGSDELYPKKQTEKHRAKGIAITAAGSTYSADETGVK
jgi:hypothetical protein